MPIFIRGQEQKMFLNGRQQNVYVHGIKVSGAQGLRFSGTQGIVVSVNQTVSDLWYEVQFKRYLAVAQTTPLVFLQSSSAQSSSLQIQRLFTQWRYAYGNIEVIDSTNLFPIGNMITAKCTKNTLTVNDTAIFQSPTDGVIDDVQNFAIGMRSPTQKEWFTNCTLYKFSLYDGNTPLVQLLPVAQGSTQYSAIPAPSNCLWDVITGAYYENVGTGTFDLEA